MMEECYILTTSTEILINIGESIAFILLANCSLMKEHKPHSFGIFLGILTKLDKVSGTQLNLPLEKKKKVFCFEDFKMICT